MARADQSPQAKRDLLIIWAYHAEQGIEAADNVLDKITQKCQDLAEMPGMGRTRDDLQSGLRGLPVGNYLIFYRRQDYGISVERVLHGARDIEAAFPVPPGEEEETP